MSDLKQTARDLLAALDNVKVARFLDEDEIQRVKALNMQLNPVYVRIYGATPLISTDYPSHICNHSGHGGWG